MPRPNLPVLQSDEPRNDFRDCVALRAKGRFTDDSTVELSFSIQFGLHHQLNNWWPFSFGITGGRIRLDVEGAEFRHGEDAPGQMPLYVERTESSEFGTQTGSKRKEKHHQSGSLSSSPKVSGGAASEREKTKSTSSRSGLETSYQAAQVTPWIDPWGWRFKNQTQTAYLDGALLKGLEGACVTKEGPLSVSATFEVRDRDIYIENSQLPFLSDIKRKLIRRKLFKKLIKPSDEKRGSLCEAKLSHEQ